MTKEDIHKAWRFLREHNHDIPDETLDFIRDAALEKLSNYCDGTNHKWNQEGFYTRKCRGCGITQFYSWGQWLDIKEDQVPKTWDCEKLDHYWIEEVNYRRCKFCDARQIGGWEEGGWRDVIGEPI